MLNRTEFAVVPRIFWGEAFQLMMQTSTLERPWNWYCFSNYIGRQIYNYRSLLMRLKLPSKNFLAMLEGFNLSHTILLSWALMLFRGIWSIASANGTFCH